MVATAQRQRTVCLDERARTYAIAGPDLQRYTLGPPREGQSPTHVTRAGTDGPRSFGQLPINCRSVSTTARNLTSSHETRTVSAVSLSIDLCLAALEGDESSLGRSPTFHALQGGSLGREARRHLSFVGRYGLGGLGRAPAHCHSHYLGLAPVLRCRGSSAPEG
jgi:hypothetical protein